ncbi:MAG: YfcE family phosphodiesterase [Anaeroplasmataceae bacterium]|nr:YfcE family phosphodiesterase [Anaeroplasmataceae bacterium]
MKLLLISDSHSFDLSNICFKEYDYVFHAGDYGKSISCLEKNNIYFVKGNCDLIGENSKVIECFGKRILLIHGDAQNVKYGLDRLIYKAMECKVDYCFFGHTHTPTFFQAENIVFINPGAFPSYVILTQDNIGFYHKGSKEIKEVKW